MIVLFSSTLVNSRLWTKPAARGYPFISLFLYNLPSILLLFLSFHLLRSASGNYYRRILAIKHLRAFSLLRLSSIVILRSNSGHFLSFVFQDFFILLENRRLMRGVSFRIGRSHGLCFSPVRQRSGTRAWILQRC